MPEPTGRDRREAESVLTYWAEKRAAVDRGVPVTTLAHDLAAMHTKEWSHRFVIALGPTNEGAALVHYGANFARLFQIPPESEPPLEIGQWLPNRLLEIFLAACRDAVERNTPVRLQRLMERA